MLQDRLNNKIMFKPGYAAVLSLPDNSDEIMFHFIKYFPRCLRKPAFASIFEKTYCAGYPGLYVYLMRSHYEFISSLLTFL